MWKTYKASIFFGLFWGCFMFIFMEILFELKSEEGIQDFWGLSRSFLLWLLAGLIMGLIMEKTGSFKKKGS